MSLTLYHASETAYAEGETIDANQFVPATLYYQRQRAANKSWIDDFLDGNGQPPNFPTRKHCCFAFDSAAMCKAFSGSERQQNVRLYEVIMTNPVAACPMWLVGELAHHPVDPLVAIATEYWQPEERRWNQLEYLSSSMTIVKQIASPDWPAVVSAWNSYLADRDTAMELFPRPAR